MKDDMLGYTLRIDIELMKKFAYVASFEGRTKNKEIEQLIKKRVAEFEKEHGAIDTADNPS
jgi:predicted DNA-binding protein